MAEDGLGLGGEDEVSADLGDEQWADPEAVAGEEELALASVPDREGEVAVHPVEASRAPLLVGLGDHLGVASGGEAMAQILELRDQLDVVVDLAVLHHPVPAVFVRERLVAAGEVDDCEPVVRHPVAPVDVEAGAVGTAVAELAGHGQEKLLGSLRSRARVDAGDAAHDLDDTGRPGRRQGQEILVLRAKDCLLLSDRRLAGSGDFSLSVMPSPDAIEEEVRQFLRDNFPLSADGVTLDREDSLIEVGVIDSTGVLELIGFIEERYEVTIADEEVLPENLDSIANLTRFVGEKTAGSNGAG